MSCPDATMANIDFSGVEGSFLGSCWCQFGDTMKMNDDDCCATTWIEGCDSTESSSTPAADSSFDMTECVGDYESFDAGWGACHTYSRNNYYYCNDDYDGENFAYQVCPECDQCYYNDYETSEEESYAPVECPATVGDGTCDFALENVHCAFGEECCCGECYAQIEATCWGGYWYVVQTGICEYTECEAMANLEVDILLVSNGATLNSVSEALEVAIMGLSNPDINSNLEIITEHPTGMEELGDATGESFITSKIIIHDITETDAHIYKSQLDVEIASGNMRLQLQTSLLDQGNAAIIIQISPSTVIPHQSAEPTQLPSPAPVVALPTSAPIVADYVFFDSETKCSTGEQRTFRLGFTTVQNCATRCLNDKNCMFFSTSDVFCIGCIGVPGNAGNGFTTYKTKDAGLVPTEMPSKAPSMSYSFYEADTKCPQENRSFKLSYTSIENCAQRCRQDSSCMYFSTDYAACIGCTAVPTVTHYGFQTFQINPMESCEYDDLTAQNACLTRLVEFLADVASDCH